MKRIPPSNKEDPIKISSKKEEVGKAQQAPADAERLMLDKADIQANSLLINEDIGFVKLPNLTEEALKWNVGREKMGRIYFLILTSQGTFTI